MHKLSNFPRVQAVHVYCDGSVDGSKSGCGLFIRNYTSSSEYTDTEVSKRLPDNLSSTRAELYAMLEGLQIVLPLGKDVYFFVDSQGALYSLLSPSPADCDLINKCLGVIDLLERDNLRVCFTWVPSHVGISHNEKADVLARHSLTEDIADCPVEHTYNNIKGQFKRHVCSTIAHNLDTCYGKGSPSSVHYVHVTYGRKSAAHDLVAMRLRLGYRYYWEVSGAAAVPCKLCHSLAGHTLAHYVMECPLLVHFRPQGNWDLPPMISWFFNNDIIPAILKDFPLFAPPL